jgi:hypothetical protein
MAMCVFELSISKGRFERSGSAEEIQLVESVTLNDMKKILALLAFAVLPTLEAFSQKRIIDMHIHSYTESDFGEREACY